MKKYGLILTLVSSRQKLEEKNNELKRMIARLEKNVAKENQRFQQSSSDFRTRIDTLNHQLTQMDKERSLLDLDMKTTRRREDHAAREICKLKEEVSIVSAVIPKTAN